MTKTTDRTTAAADRRPYRIRLGRDRHLDLGVREAGLAAAALGLGYAAYKGVAALLSSASKKAAVAPGHDGRVDAVPVADTATPAIPASATMVGTDTGAEFVGEQPGADRDAAPFVAASSEDDTGDLLVEVTEVEIVSVASVDDSAATPEHVPTDLMGDRAPGAGDRAIDAFRPDPTAPVPPEMRDSLRPATGPAPGFAATRGTFASGLSQTDGSK